MFIEKLNNYFNISDATDCINNNDIYFLREDLIPFSFGGNKVRKSIYFFKEILSCDYNYIVTYGSITSNHARIIANMASIYDIPCLIISPNNKKKNCYNRKLVELFGAKIKLVDINKVSFVIEASIIKLKKKDTNLISLRVADTVFMVLKHT